MLTIASILQNFYISKPAKYCNMLAFFQETSFLQTEIQLFVAKE